MSEMIYKWKEGSCMKSDAAVVGPYLESLRIANGGSLTAETVVESARPEESPIHVEFNWDDIEAARLYRLDQGKHMLRSVFVIRQDRPDVKVNAFVSILHPGDKRRSYTSIEVARSDPDLWAQVLAAAKAEMESFKRRYKDYEAFSEVIVAIDNTVRRLSA